MCSRLHIYVFHPICSFIRFLLQSSLVYQFWIRPEIYEAHKKANVMLSYMFMHGKFSFYNKQRPFIIAALHLYVF